MATNEYTPTPYHGFKDPERGAKKYLEYISDNIADYDTRIAKKGTKADRPAAGTENRWYLAVDEPAIYYDDGSAWQKVAGADASGGAVSADEFLATADGSTTDPAFAWDGDQDTGFYRVGAGTIGVTTGGTKAAEFGAGGGLTLPNGGATVSGDIDDGTNTIWDAANARIGAGLVDATSLDLSIAPTWTGTHTWDTGTGANLSVDEAGPFFNTANAETLNVRNTGTGSVTLQQDGTAVVPETRALTGGDGIAAIGDLSADRTVAVALAAGGGLKFATGEVAVEPADFAGAFLSDDGADALQANLGAFLSGDGADNIQVNTGSGIKGDGADNLTVEPADIAGHGLQDDGSDNLELQERVHYAPGHTEWADGLADEEVKRIVPPTGAAVHIDVLGFYQKGGGSSTSVDVDVYDAGAATELASVNLGSTDRTGYSGGSGNTVLVRVANASGAAVNAEPVVRGRIA